MSESESVPIKAYVDVRFDATNLAVQKAEAAALALHAATNNIAATMMPKGECQQALHSIEMRTEALQKLVWTGLGIMIAVNVAIGLVVAWKH